jgi:hypothetical protein
MVMVGRMMTCLHYNSVLLCRYRQPASQDVKLVIVYTLRSVARACGCNGGFSRKLKRLRKGGLIVRQQHRVGTAERSTEEQGGRGSLCGPQQ